MSATVTSAVSSVMVRDGNLSFGTVGSGAAVTSSDTFTIRVDLRYPYNENNLTWNFTYDSTACTDGDHDGFAIEGGECGPVDCGDSDPSSHPGASEVCDAKDNDCDGETDEGVQNTYYEDVDRDGYGNRERSIQTCTAPSAYVANNTDCNDADAAIHPGATDIPNDEIDQDCDGMDSSISCTDADHDGFAVEGGACGPKDCDDTKAGINPGAKEICGDTIDQDCDNKDLLCSMKDADGDLWSVAQGDCDDTNPNMFPGATDFP